MTDQRPSEPRETPEPEVRTKRLVIVNDDGLEQVAIQLDRGLIELRLGGSGSNLPCEVVLFAGEDEPGSYAAGIELRANGNSVGGTVVTVAGSHVELHHFGPEE